MLKNMGSVEIGLPKRHLSPDINTEEDFRLAQAGLCDRGSHRIAGKERKT